MQSGRRSASSFQQALSFDYSLFTMTRFAEERKHGATMEEAIDPWSSSNLTFGAFSLVIVTMLSALLETHHEEKVITQSGHVVMVSGLAPWIKRMSLNC